MYIFIYIYIYKQNKTKKQLIVSTSGKVPTDDCFSRPINLSAVL